MITRDPIYAALFAKLSAASGFMTTSRSLMHWNDVKPSDQPAMFLVSGAENAKKASLGLPTEWTLQAKVYLYARTEKGTVPATVLHAIIDAIEQSLAPDVGTGKQNLGGLCQHCYLSAIEHDEGLLGQQGVAIVSINIDVV